MTLIERVISWFFQRRLRKELRLNRKEFGVFKKMFLDNWFSTLGGVVIAAIQAYQAGGVSLKTALIVGIGVVLKDNIPGLQRPIQ